MPGAVGRLNAILGLFLTRDRRGTWLRTAGATIGVIALALSLAPFARQDPRVVATLRGFVLPAAMLVLLLLVAVRHERRWRNSASRLRQAVRAARLGDAPAGGILDAAPADNPELGGIAAEVFRLAKDLREQQRLVRRLEVECQHKVAFRTDELERQVGLLKAKATRDALTGLNNRGSFDELFPAMLQRARDAGRDLSVVMADLDHFKTLNDTLGHPAGDAMLRDVGRLIRSAVREDDAAFRYGGDEFVLVLDGADPKQARSTADRLARLVDDLGAGLDGLPRRPGLSAGVASLSAYRDAGPEGLLRAADEDAYATKSSRKRRRLAA